MALHVSSSAFENGQPIPERYTCDGQNVSPPLKWTGHPLNTKGFALICDDPDAPSGTFTHWILYDLPPSVTELREGVPSGGKEGVNSFRKSGYGGPCPPSGPAHRYFFHVYAIDVDTLGQKGLGKPEIVVAMKGHVLAEGQVMGTYARKK